MSENYKFFQHRECEYFPCHQVEDDTTFNCMFCYCPLYMLGEECGGNFKYTNGMKDCSGCLKNHARDGHENIMKHIGQVLEIGSKRN